MRVHAFLLYVGFLLLRIEPAAASSRIIDDADTYSNDTPDGIQYSPHWQSSTSYPQQYGNTLHYSSTPGSDLIYFFQGNAVQYIGDKNPHTLTTLWLDGVPARINASNATQLQQPLWSKQNLGPGDHELVIRHEGTYESPVTLDFLRIEYEETYLPLVSGPAASIVPPNALIVDDTRLDLIEYSPSSSWNDTPHSGVPFNNSLQATTHPGAAITFKFNGTAIWYLSDTNLDHGKAHITLDGTLGTTIVGFSTHHLNQRLLWSATDLADGEHTVVITHADADGKFMTVDFFRYLPSPTPEAASVNTITSTVVVSHSPTATSRPTTGTTASPELLIKAIIGGILGGLTLFSLLGAFVYLCYRFKRSRLGHPEDYKPDYTISPYGYASPYIVVNASSSAVFSEPRISEDTRPLMSSMSYLTLPDLSRFSTAPTIGSLPSVYHTRSSSISSDVFITSVPPTYR